LVEAFQRLERVRRESTTLKIITRTLKVSSQGLESLESLQLN